MGDPLDFRLDKRYIHRLFWLVTSLRFVICDGDRLGDGAPGDNEKL